MVMTACLFTLPGMFPFQRLLFSLIIGLLAASRVCSGSHFVSQTVAGALLGLLWSRMTKKTGTQHLAASAIACPVIYYFLGLFHLDVSHSFKLATDACKDPKGVSATAPFVWKPWFFDVGVTIALALIRQDPQQVTSRWGLLLFALLHGSFMYFLVIRGMMEIINPYVHWMCIGFLCVVPAYIACVYRHGPKSQRYARVVMD